MPSSSLISPRPGQPVHARRSLRAFTLVEVTVAVGVLSLLMAGIFATILQSRRITEGSIYQNSAIATVQGYIEQIKNMEFAEIPYTDSAGNLYLNGVLTPSGAAATDPRRRVATRLDDLTLDPLYLTTVAIPNLTSVNVGTTPSGVVDNLKVIDINQTTTTKDDLNLNVWLWVQDVTDASLDATQVRAITLVYTYAVNDGNKKRLFRGSVRTIRSAVPTF